MCEQIQARSWMLLLADRKIDYHTSQHNSWFLWRLWLMNPNYHKMNWNVNGKHFDGVLPTLKASPRKCETKWNFLFKMCWWIASHAGLRPGIVETYHAAHSSQERHGAYQVIFPSPLLQTVSLTQVRHTQELSPWPRHEGFGHWITLQRVGHTEGQDNMGRSSSRRTGAGVCYWRTSKMAPWESGTMLGSLALFSSCLVALGVFCVAKLNACDVFKYASSLSLKLFTTIIDAKVLSWLTVWPVLFYYGRIQDWGSRTLWLVQGSACPWDSWSFSLIHDAVKMNCCCSSGPLHDMYGTDPWNYFMKLHV